MNVNDLKQSRFLTKNDVGRGVLATIREIYQENVAKEGAPEELKWIISFEELEKPMVLNSTNGQMIAKITGSDESDGWIGHKIVLYDDPNISFAGKLTGGIRVRAPRNQTPQQAPRPAQAPAHRAPAPQPARPQPQQTPQPQAQPEYDPGLPPDEEVPF